MPAVKIGIVGDFNPRFPTHLAIDAALEHTATALGITIEANWLPTRDLARDGADEVLAGFDGIWASPGSPYDSMDGMLRGIEFARTNATPFQGTCGGCQYALIEFARHVLHIADADTAENHPSAVNSVIKPVYCAVPRSYGDLPVLHGEGAIRLIEGSRLRSIYGVADIEERYFCSFEVNGDYVAQFEAAGLRVAGLGPAGEVRAVELPSHPFFVATLFQPQVASKPGNPHRLVAAFAKAAQARADEGSAANPAATSASGAQRPASA
jgi:CTP synthase (UTP-ammonia lyase)